MNSNSGPQVSGLARWSPSLWGGTELLAFPSEHFEWMRTSPVQAAHWLIPTLVCSWAAAAGGTITPDPAGLAQLIERVAVVWLGTLTSGSILWLLARLALRSRVSWWKLVAVAGLANWVAALGWIVAALLRSALARDHAAAGPVALLEVFDPGNRGHLILQTLDFFQIWSVALMSVGLAKLTARSGLEGFGWVFGFWFGVRWLGILFT